MKTMSLYSFAICSAVILGVVLECRADLSWSAVSPDGRNEIRLYSSPLSYQVSRDGAVVAARTGIGLSVDGKALEATAAEPKRATRRFLGGVALSPVYKKSSVDMAARETFVDFGDWGVRLCARNDGVAYRFETSFKGRVRICGEKASVSLPSGDAVCRGGLTDMFGYEEVLHFSKKASELNLSDKMLYLPFGYSAGGKFVVFTESDLSDYPVLYFGSYTNGTLTSKFSPAVKKTQYTTKDGKPTDKPGSLTLKVLEQEDYLVETAGTRTLPWRVFILADEPAKVCEADIVWALAREKDDDADFSWVKPGMAVWDWWSAYDHKGYPDGCTTEAYRKFIDLAASRSIPYVVFDAGWAENKLNIWKFNPAMDVPFLIKYARAKGVDIILWIAWTQAYGDEERVASHFAKLGAKGFKVDFIDRSDSEAVNFTERFAAACAKHGMVIDYHGVFHPTGLNRRYPNVLNYEGIRGLEYHKWFDDDEKAAMFNDVAAAYLRMSAGPMDYTPGAMVNHGIGSGYKGSVLTPGSVGTRCRQMAMMALYEAPLQMLADSPTNYAKNDECFSFMAAVPTVWKSIIGLAGTPETVFVAAREAKDGSWYAFGINTAEARDVMLATGFLRKGEWRAEIFRDAGDAREVASKYVRETKTVKPGDKLPLHMAPGGGFIIRFVRK